MNAQGRNRLKRSLKRIGEGIAQNTPAELEACEICRKTECIQDEWIVCENRIAHAKYLEEVQDEKRS